MDRDKPIGKLLRCIQLQPLLHGAAQLQPLQPQLLMEFLQLRQLLQQHSGLQMTLRD